MSKLLLPVLAAVALWCTLSTTHAFRIPQHGKVATRSPSSSSSTTTLNMAPRYDMDSERWFVTDEETEGPSAGYGIIGSLYRAGPVPFFQRIFNADGYEQGVMKYQAQQEAQANMDAFLENPQDWAYQKMQEVSQNTSPPILSTITEKNGAPIKDYVNANMEPKQTVLSTVWAGVVVVFGYDLVTGVAEGRKHNNSQILIASVLLTLSFSQDSSACLAKTASSTNNLSLFASLNKISYSNILYIGNLLGYALNTLESSGYGPFLSRFSSDQNNASVSQKNEIFITPNGIALV
eukprot:scaffold244_cov200-Alexandrium_tamarense.AAC.15